MNIDDTGPGLTQITLGLLAGGRGIRLGGVDKAWLCMNGVPLVLHWSRHFAIAIPAQLVSANCQLQRYAEHGLQAVMDRHHAGPSKGNAVSADASVDPIRLQGPLAGIDALLAATTTRWLLTLPVDALQLPPDFIERIWNERDEDGSVAADATGPQPLFALYRVDHAQPLVEAALHDGDLAVHRLQARMSMGRVDFPGFRFGNLNTPTDLATSGIAA
ncbi:MAG: NTP transferase domain-containing protein [Lysobacteraceae bacterium]